MTKNATSTIRAQLCSAKFFLHSSIVIFAIAASGCGQSALNVGPLDSGRDATAVTRQDRDIAGAHTNSGSVSSAPNGVYAYGSTSAFPSSSYNTSNYWVDVVFKPSVGGAESIFTAGSTPQTITEDDPQAVELGVRFQSSVAGSITGVRYYRGPRNTGTHVANLWTATGSRIATATFVGESSSGWQQTTFASPVPVTPGATYVASYHTTVGYYSVDSPYFSRCRTNGSLTADGASPCIATNPSPSPAPSSTPAPKPSATPTGSGGGDLSKNLCIGGSTYTLDDHDWFDRDASLSVSDSWPEQGGTEWSNSFSWARYNNVGVDLSYYPSKAQLAPGGFTAGGLPPVAVLDPGVGVQLKSYSVPRPTTSAENNTFDIHYQSYFSGLLSNSKAYTNGYWVYRAQLPGGNGWWPALWLLSENGGNYFELDNEEQWGPNVLGSNVVAQTEQGSPALYTRTVVPTSTSAMHSYGALATSRYVAFYIDGTPTTSQYPRYEQTALNPIMNLQVCSSNSYCGPAPAVGQTSQMTVAYYAHYSPPTTPAPCAPNDINTPKP